LIPQKPAHPATNQRPARSTIEGGGAFAGLFEAFSTPQALAQAGGATQILATRNFVLSRSRVHGLRLCRNVPRLRRDGLDLFALILRGAGPADARSACGARLEIRDLAQPFVLDALNGEAGDFLALWIPRSRVLRGFANELALHGLSLPRDLPAADIMASALECFARHAESLTLDEFDAAATGLVELAASAINQRLRTELGPALGSPVASFVAIRRYIDQNIASPSLNAEKLAALFGLSRASLYRLFEPVGGVGTYIRTARLSRAHQEIVAPQNADRRAGHIAMSLGFPSPAAFNRAFRETYGLSPKQARERALAPVAAEQALVLAAGGAGLSHFLGLLQK
jgi:AraC-like DNA-binding protein